MFCTKKDEEIDRLRFLNDSLDFQKDTYREGLKNCVREKAELKKMVFKWRNAYYKELRKRIELERKYKALKKRCKK